MRSALGLSTAAWNARRATSSRIDAIPTAANTAAAQTKHVSRFTITAAIVTRSADLNRSRATAAWPGDDPSQVAVDRARVTEIEVRDAASSQVNVGVDNGCPESDRDRAALRHCWTPLRLLPGEVSTRSSPGHPGSGSEVGDGSGARPAQRADLRRYSDENTAAIDNPRVNCAQLFRPSQWYFSR